MGSEQTTAGECGTALETPSTPDPALLLRVAAFAAVVGHCDGTLTPDLVLWQDGTALLVTVTTDEDATTDDLRRATRCGLDAAVPYRDWGGARVLDVDGDFPAPDAVDLLVEWGVAHGASPGRVHTAAQWPQLLTPSRLAQMVTHAAAYLGSAQVGPLSGLPLLTDDEHRRLVVELNQTAVPLPDLSAGELLARSAAGRDATPAVLDSAGVLSYGELMSLAATLAAELAAAGVRPGDQVHLCLPRSSELVLAWVAVLGMGAVCVPVDPAYPAERIGRIVGVGQGATVLCVPATAALVPGAAQITVDVAALRARRHPHPPQWPVTRSLDSTAYVLHTSGSTGTPKGAAISHRGLVNLLQASSHEFGLLPGARCLQLASPGFDVSVWEILATLHAGATVVPYEPAAVSPSQLTAWTARFAVDVVFALSSLLVHLAPDCLANVRTIVTGGELFNRDLVARWQPGRQLIYVYGPTEATVFQSWHQCVASAGEPPATIGRPMDNLRYYVLDPWGGYAVPGAVGELFIGGAGPGTGYVGLAEATAQRFLSRPRLDPDGHVYRTGDLASFRADGAIEFRGRADNQVKLRGFRIELGEVETALAARPEIDAAAVVVHEADVERFLVGYVTIGRDQPVPDITALRDTLAGSLPYYMVPSEIEVLPTLPYTPHGKVDRRALAARAPAGRPVEEPGRPIDDPLVGTVLEVFASVLHRPGMGARDDFFGSGGHSLAATEAAAMLSARCARTVRVRDVFESPSAVALAGALAARQPSTGAAGVHHRALPDRRDLLPVQRWQWLLQQSRPGGDAAYNVPGLFDCGTAAVDPAILQEALAMLRRRHALLRVTIHAERGLPQVRPDDTEVRLEMVDLVTAEDPDRALSDAVGQRVNRPFELSQGPLLRASLLRLPGDRNLLLVVVHHAVCDGPGLEVLARDLAALYEVAAAPDVAAGPPALPHDPLRLAAAESDRFEAGEFDADLDYWRARLTPPPAALPLPVDAERRGAAGRHTDVVRAQLPAGTTAALRQLVQGLRSGLLTALTGAVAAVLQHATGRRDVCMGTPVNIAGALGLNEHVSCCANSVALRLELTDGSWRQLLTQVAERVHEAVDHARYPFDRLLHAMSVPVPPLRNPLFDVWVTCYPRIDTGSACGLTLSGAPVPLDTGLFDLSFQGCEHPDGLSLLLQYDRDLYQQETAELLLERVVGALRELAAGAERPWRGGPAPAPTSTRGAPPAFGGFQFGPP